MSIEAIEAVIELIEMGAVVGTPAVIKCLRSALDEPEPKREWVGLTEDEVSKILDDVIGFNSCWGPETEFARAIEAKLKEKNT